MRPIKLTIQAIGPFKGKVEIDFSKIGARELFLIYGKTGSGKTTLFDAICFALYGTVPSGREKSLKSDFALETDKPYVEFEFELREIRYKAYRQLRYRVPYKTKEGTKGCQEELQFCQMTADGKWKTLALQTKEMKVAVQERIGLDVNQFSQVILLPQGDFRQLLLANSKDREALLEKLFESSLYDGVQGWFESEVKRFNADNSSVEEKRKIYLNQVREMIPEERRPAEDATFGVETVEDEIALLKVQIKIDQTGVNKLVKAAETRLKALETARQLTKDLSELGLRQDEQRELNDHKKVIDLLRSELKKARQAAPLVPEMKEIRRKEKSIVVYNQKLTETTREHKKAVKRKQEADKGMRQLPKLKKSVDVSETVNKQAEALLRTLKSLNDLDDQCTEFTTTFKDADYLHKESTKQLKDLTKQLITKTAAGDKLKIAAVDTERLHNQLKKQNDALALKADIQKHTAKLNRLKEVKISAEKKKTIAEKMLSDLNARWNHNAAGLLAQGLEDGNACPVCGSKNHPHTAVLVDKDATREAIESAEKNLHELEADAEKAALAAKEVETVLGIETKNLKLIESDLGEEISDKSAKNTKKQINAEIERQSLLEKVNREIHNLETVQVPQTKENLAKQESEKSAATKNLNMLNKEIKKQNDIFAEQCIPPIEDRLEGDEVDIADIEELAEEAADESVGIKAEIERIKEEASEAKELLAGVEGTLKENRSSVKQAEAELKTLKGHIESKIASSPFNNDYDIEESFRSTEWIEEADKDIKDHESRMASVTAIIKTLTTRIAKRKTPDVDDLEGIYKEHKSKADEATVSLHGLQHAAESQSKLADSIRELESESKEIAVKMKVLGRLEAQVRGNGKPKISLKRFFLAQRLDEVLIQASGRLRDLSDGRFNLKRDPNAKNGSIGGLDLLVSDSFTGTERPVNSMSGGQMFLASLSMALGLADVVQARSGGIRLDTLFVDEGFGSLDDETLQGVLKVLNKLRKGRMVGVISHVNELKRQIENRIEVLPAAVGSKISMQLA